MAQKQTYTSEEVAQCLLVVDANGGNVLKSSRDLGIPHRTLASWVRRERRTPDVSSALTVRAERIRKQRDELADQVGERAMEALVQLKERIPTMTGKDLAYTTSESIREYLSLTGGTRTTQDVNVTVTLADLYRKVPLTIDVSPVPTGESQGMSIPLGQVERG